MSGFVHHGVRGLGDLLYETAAIAFDTSTGLFKNPQTGTTYGPNPPTGGWPISWYQDSAGNVQVPTGSGAVAQNQQQAQQIANQVVQSMAAQGQTVLAPQASVVAEPSIPPVSPPPAVTNSSSAVPVSTSGSSSDLLYNIPSTNASIDLTTLWNNYWWLILIAGGAAFFLFRSK